MSKKVEVFLPINGEVLPISEVNDYLFNKKVMGEGVAIKPTEFYVCSPVDGEIVLVYDAKHAIAIENEDGLKFLIHVGLDSAKLQGRGFGLYVNVGDKVKAGDKILFFDGKYLEDKTSLVTPMVITNSELIESMNVDYKVKIAGKKFAEIILK